MELISQSGFSRYQLCPSEAISLLGVKLTRAQNKIKSGSLKIAHAFIKGGICRKGSLVLVPEPTVPFKAELNIGQKAGW